MKAKVLGFILTASLTVVSLPAMAGIPVIDATSNTTRVMNFTRQMVEYAKMLTEAQRQLQQQRATYEAMIGSRNIGALFNNPALAQYLPQGMQGLYNDIKNNNVSGAAGKLAAIAGQYQNTSNNHATNMSNVAQRQQDNAVKNRMILDEVFQSSNQRLNQLSALMNSIDGTADPKAAADLGNRINSEVALLQAEQSKIQLVKMMTEAEDKLLQQQQRTAILEYNRGSGKNVAQMQPIRF